ncbi:dihydrofolate reductase family protein [Crossiella cryophila]|uniref:Dihydrofolate reductase n=1 Tax=Crossiella cryophila TaxID=43355 RepID=A0A7W7CI21_9PSEU|nr:dihydrofolate reductase family protein [Crossiella cryophila]MBB4681599.1 dihydrofolate reductase [Crossiella cryophila]
MGRVIAEITVSVDGFVAGPEVSAAQPMGLHGLRLHHWLGFGDTPPSAADLEVAGRMFANTGAFVLGRRLFDVGIGKWGGDGAWQRPCFVLTNRERSDHIQGVTRFMFVTDGVRRAVDRARAAAGGRDVVVAGGAQVIRAAMHAGLVEELRLHVAPVLLGAGTSLFDQGPRLELEPVLVESSAAVTHVTYRVPLPTG